MRVKTIAQMLAKFPEVKAVVLFGSVARDDAKPSSDVDLLVMTSKKGAEEKITMEAVKLQKEAGRELQTVVKTEEELRRTNPALLQNIAHHGKLIYLAPGAEIPIREFISGKLMTIFCYDISHLDQEKKNALNRALYGYRQKTRGKVYEAKGTLELHKGERIGKAVVMVPSEQKEVFKGLFNDAGAKFRQIHVQLI